MWPLEPYASGRNGVPRMETVIVKSDDVAPQGGGEPPITTTGAVIANAIFDATGARVFKLPMTGERVRLAMSQSTANRSRTAMSAWEEDHDQGNELRRGM